MRKARASADPVLHDEVVRVSRDLIRAKAALRVSFAGGGTDVPPYPADEGGAVLSATINRYAFVTLRPRDDRQVTINSLDFGLAVDFGIDEPIVFDGRLDLVKAAVARVCDGEAGGFDLLLHTNAPPGSGLGASSALAVCVAAVLEAHQGIVSTPYELAHLAYVLEREDLGISGGLQDHYSATFGGFNYMEFLADHVVVNPLRVDQGTLNELEHNMLLCYTGRTRLSDQIIDDQQERYLRQEEDTAHALRMQKELARQMKDALLRQHCDDFGALLGEAWRWKRRMSPRIATPFIDEACDVATACGALGGKVTGAGGGGYLLFYCPYDRKHLVAEGLMKLGLDVSEFGFEWRGVTTWRIRA